MQSSKIVSAARYLLGGAFALFGLNGFLHFLPQPPMSGPPAELFGAFAATGYMIPFIKGTEVVAGALLLSNRYVPLALTILAPVLLHILAFHAFLAPAGLALPVVLTALNVFLAYSYRNVFTPMLAARAQPASSPRSERRPAHAHA